MNVLSDFNITFSGWFICTHCLRFGDWSIYKSHLFKSNTNGEIPIPKLFKDGIYFQNMIENLKSFKSLKSNTKRSILKCLNMEV